MLYVDTEVKKSSIEEIKQKVKEQKESIIILIRDANVTSESITSILHKN